MRCSSIDKQLITRLWMSWGQPGHPTVLNAHANRQTHTGVWLPGLTIVCCINIVIAESQVEGNG